MVVGIFLWARGYDWLAISDLIDKSRVARVVAVNDIERDLTLSLREVFLILCIRHLT